MFPLVGLAYQYQSKTCGWKDQDAWNKSGAVAPVFARGGTAEATYPQVEPGVGGGGDLECHRLGAVLAGGRRGAEPVRRILERDVRL